MNCSASLPAAAFGENTRNKIQTSPSISNGDDIIPLIIEVGMPAAV